MMPQISRRLLPLLLVLAARTAVADQVKYLSAPKTALAAFVSTLAEARSSIDIATFIFESCEPSTQVMLDILARKAKSGVRVRVLLDSFLQKNPTRDALVAFLTEAGAQIKFYNQLEPNMRMHIKMLVVDGKRYIAGGRNLSDRYFGLSSTKNFIDRDVLVTGDSAAQAAAAFEELWKTPLSSTPRKKSSFADWTRVCGDQSARIEDIRELLDQQGHGLLADVPERKCNQVRFVADHPDFGSAKYGMGQEHGSTLESYMTPMRMDRKVTTKSLLAFFSGAKSTLSMENWIYVPLSDLDYTFENLRARKVNLQVITNEDTEEGPAIFREAIDYAVKVHADRDSKGSQRVRLISSKGGIAAAAAFELTPKGAMFFLHGKVALRDGNDVLVGSFNLDSRSYSTNLESAVIVKNCGELAGDVRFAMDGLVKIYEDDVQYKRVPKKKEASFAAKMFAMFSLVLL